MYYFIINPSSCSGNGLIIWKTIEPILISKGTEYCAYFTEGTFHATRLAAEITSQNEFNKLIILGGDGTINEVITGISDLSKTIIGYIPTGSSNDLARSLKLKRDPHKALDAILSPSHYESLDVGVIEYGTEKRRFAVATGIGFDAAICHEAFRSKIKDFFNKLGLGKLSYTGIALKQLALAKPCRCDILLDDQKKIHLDKFFFVTTMIHKYEGGGFMFCPEADYGDGILDLCIVGNISKWKLLSMLPGAFSGKHVTVKGIQICRAKKVVIHSAKPLPIHSDGESCNIQNTITMTIEPTQLKIIR